MQEIINLAEKQQTLKYLERIRNNDYVPFDIRIDNSHIKELNELTGVKLFSKSSLYINSKTLYDIMQAEGKSDNHNFHGLTPEDVYMSLFSIKDPRCVFITKFDRYAIVSVELSHFDYPLMMVIEKDSGLQNDTEARVNKVITIYPKDHIDEYIAKLDERMLLYKKV